MKKTYKYIMTVAVVMVGLIQFTSCNDANDWTVDPSLVKQRPPTDLKVELQDSATLDLSVQIGTIANAASYELQVSTSQLTSNGDLPVEGEIYTFDGITKDNFDKGKFIIKRSIDDNGKFTVEQNKTYYFRVRAIGKDGTVSNWYTNGQLYYGGISDETLAQSLMDNTTKNVKTNSDGEYVGPVLVTPATLWIGLTDVESTSLKLNWHETKYVTAKYLRNETLGEEIEVSQGTVNTKYTETTVWSYQWTGLEVEKEYTFSLLDEERNVISTVTKSTERDPIREISYFIGGFPTFATSDKDFTLNSVDANGNETDIFSGKFIVGSKMKSESKKSSNNGFISPFDKTKVFQPLSPGYVTESADGTNYNRISTGGSASSIELNIPARGRLYIYAGNGGTLTVTQYGDEEEELSKTVYDVPASIKYYANGGTEFMKTYVETEINGKKVVKTTLTWSKGIYLCGMHFVPWEEIPTSTPSADQPTE